MCVLLDTFYQCLEMTVAFFDANISRQLIQQHVWERKYIIFSM